MVYGYWLAVVFAPLVGWGQDRPAPPQFKSGVEMLAVDVQVVDDEGEPVLGLTPDRFTVKIDGRTRRVATVQFLEQSSRSRFIDARGEPAAVDSPDVTGAGRASHGRIFVLAIDENSFWSGHARAANEAARLFIDRLAPEDYIGLATFPGTGQAIAPTREHHVVRDALDRLVGLKSPPPGGMTAMGASEVFDITAGDTETLERVVARECPPLDRTCRKRVQMDASMLAQDMSRQALQSIGGLRGLLGGLAQIDGRKIVVLISAGMAVSDRVGAGGDVRAQTHAVGRQAAAANTTLYILHVDVSFLEAFSSRSGKVLPSLMRDSSLFINGLGIMAGSAGGEMFRVFTDSDHVFDRVLRETSAHYLLGVEPLESDRDGKPHRIAVDVKQPGVTVRSRTTIIIR
jgi:VWFA-related protein